MSRAAKVGVVLGGYVAAGLAAMAAGWLYNARVATYPYDTSGGMYAAGEMLSGVAAFLVVALVPTLLWFWFVRRHEGFWNAVAILCLVYAGIGLMAVLAPLGTHRATAHPVHPGSAHPGSAHSGSAQPGSVHPALVILDLVGLSQLLGVPIWATAFALFSMVAPTPRTRQQLSVALGIELIIGVCAIVHWFVPHAPL
jgi:hypothetical protein